MTDLDYLLNQLGLLIGFLDVSDEEVYNQIKTHDRFQFGLTIEQLYKGKYENYSQHICSSAFILGFTHLEDFVTKRLTCFLERYSDKNDFKVTLRLVREKAETLESYAACEQTRRMTFSEKIKFIEKHIPEIEANIISGLRQANDVRNCLMHNNGIADSRLEPSYKADEKIIMSSGKVNGFGLTARQFARELWDKTNWH